MRTSAVCAPAGATVSQRKLPISRHGHVFADLEAELLGVEGEGLVLVENPNLRGGDLHGTASYSWLAPLSSRNVRCCGRPYTRTTQLGTIAQAAAGGCIARYSVEGGVEHALEAGRERADAGRGRRRSRSRRSTGRCCAAARRRARADGSAGTRAGDARTPCGTRVKVRTGQAGGRGHVVDAERLVVPEVREVLAPEEMPGERDVRHRLSVSPMYTLTGPRRPRTRRAGDEAHLHLDRRGAGAGDLLAAADRRGVRRRSRRRGRDCATSRSPGASSRMFPDRLTEEQRSQRRARRARASWPRRPRRTSSSCPTSAPRSRSCKAAIKELQDAGLRGCPDYPDEPERRDEERDQARATTRSRAARSTRCCARATPTAAPPRRSRRTPSKHPHSMGAWSTDSKTHVVDAWSEDDFSLATRSR